MDLERGTLRALFTAHTEITSHALWNVPELYAIDFTYLQETTLSEVTPIPVHSAVDMKVSNLMSTQVTLSGKFRAVNVLYRAIFSLKWFATFEVLTFSYQCAYEGFVSFCLFLLIFLKLVS